MRIEVQKQDESTYVVTVNDQKITKHTVKIPPGYCEKLSTTPERLLVASFEFLLEREPNTSILRSFDLSLIGNYFPEYESEIRSRL